MRGLNQATKDFLKTLRRVPDAIMLCVAGLEIDAEHHERCVVGRLADVTAEGVNTDLTGFLAVTYGGKKAAKASPHFYLHSEWERVNWAFNKPDELDALETAFAIRVAEAANPKPRVR